MVKRNGKLKTLLHIIVVKNFQRILTAQMGKETSDLGNSLQDLKPENVVL